MYLLKKLLPLYLVSTLNVLATNYFQPLNTSPAELFKIDNGSVELSIDNNIATYRWSPEAGKTSTLELHPDHPLLQRLRYFDTFSFDFRIASGEVSDTSLLALGHVSGARQFRVHQWQVAILTTPTKVWHHRSIDLARPNWFPWDSADGTDGNCYFRFTTLALTPGTTLEIRAAALYRAPLRLKADFIPPDTWPILTRHPDGNFTYNFTLHVQNASGAPANATAKVTSSNRCFDVRLKSGNDEESADQDLATSVTFPLKHVARNTITVVAQLSARQAASWGELDSEEVRIEIALDSHPEAPAVWQGFLTKPLSTKLQRQVIIPVAELDSLRKELKETPETTAKMLNMPRLIKIADDLLQTEFLCLPRSSAHVRNGYVGNWRPTNRMPEVVNTETGETQLGTEIAGRTWKEYLGQFGKGCHSLTMAYLYTQNEAYAEKAIELLLLHAREFKELPWTIQSETPWSQGDYILGASRLAWNSSYGSNWYYKDYCRMISALTTSPAWTPEVAHKIYLGFVVPYAQELMKFRGGLSNMTDITNHNIFLLGLVFDDANLIRWALLNDTGLLNRLADITPDGFSSEGRPVSYHYGAMAEYLPTLTYVVRSGLNVTIPRQNLAEALLMPYRRASLWGRIPSTGDCGRGLSIGSNPLTAQMMEIVGDSTPELAYALRSPSVAPDEWRKLLETKPRLFEAAGLAILRSGDTTDTQIMATLDYGRNVFHSHLDRNQFTLLAFGKSFTMGPGSGYNVGSGGMVAGEHPTLSAFRSNASLAQNVILVDTRNQEPAIGKLRGWGNEKDRCWAASEVNGIHPGVTHERGVMLQDGIIIMLDRITGDTPHTYDWVYHNLGTFTLADNWTATPLEKPLAEHNLYDKLVNPARLTGTTPLHATWDLSWNLTPNIIKDLQKREVAPSPIKLALWQLSSHANEIYSAVTGINNQDTIRMPDSAPSLICRASDKSVTWLTVLEPYKEVPRVTGVETSGSFGIKVHLTNGKTITTEWSKITNR